MLNINTEYEFKRDNKKVPHCWFSEYQYCEPHFHSTLELLLVLKGSITAYISDEKFIVNENEFVLVSDYSTHSFKSENGYNACVLMTIPLDFVPSFKNIFKNKSFSKIKGSVADNKEIIHLLFKLQDLCENHNMNTLTAKGYVYALLGNFVDILGLQDYVKNQEQNFQRDLLIYINKNFLNDLSVESVAKNFGYSKSHFLHIFKGNFKFSFKDYVNMLRCKNALNLMINGNVKMIDAAMNSGFNNLRSFYRNFKLVYNLTPSEYLKTYSANKTD